MATKTIKAWINGAIQEIEVEEITSPEQPLSHEDRLNELEDKPIITDGNFLVGNGTKDLDEMTPDEVLSHINGASVMPITADEYENLEESNTNTLYVITDDNSDDNYYTKEEVDDAFVDACGSMLVGAGIPEPPTTVSKLNTFYFDSTNKMLYMCMAGQKNWIRLSDIPNTTISEDATAQEIKELCKQGRGKEVAIGTIVTCNYRYPTVEVQLSGRGGDTTGDEIYGVDYYKFFNAINANAKRLGLPELTIDTWADTDIGHFWGNYDTCEWSGEGYVEGLSFGDLGIYYKGLGTSGTMTSDCVYFNTSTNLDLKWEVVNTSDTYVDLAMVNVFPTPIQYDSEEALITIEGKDTDYIYETNNINYDIIDSQFNVYAGCESYYSKIEKDDFGEDNDGGSTWSGSTVELLETINDLRLHTNVDAYAGKTMRNYISLVPKDEDGNEVVAKNFEISFKLVTQLKWNEGGFMLMFRSQNSGRVALNETTPYAQRAAVIIGANGVGFVDGSETSVQNTKLAQTPFAQNKVNDVYENFTSGNVNNGMSQEMNINVKVLGDKVSVKATSADDTIELFNGDRTITWNKEGTISLSGMLFDNVLSDIKLSILNEEGQKSGLNAGVYSIELIEGTVAEVENETIYDGIYEFTTSKYVPVGGKIRHTTMGVSYDVENADPTMGYFITYDKAGNVIEDNIACVKNDLLEESYFGVTTAKKSVLYITNSNINTTERNQYGNNEYRLSAIRQWANSDKPAGEVWKSAHKFDMAPVWASTEDGFMYNLDKEFINCLTPVDFECEPATYNGATLEPSIYTVRDYFAPMSAENINHNVGGADAEGEVFTKYASVRTSDKSSASNAPVSIRNKYLPNFTNETKGAVHYGLRSAWGSYSGRIVYLIHSHGGADSLYCKSPSNGVVLTCRIAGYDL